RARDPCQTLPALRERGQAQRSRTGPRTLAPDRDRARWRHVGGIAALGRRAIRDPPAGCAHGATANDVALSDATLNNCLAIPCSKPTWRWARVASSGEPRTWAS